MHKLNTLYLDMRGLKSTLDVIRQNLNNYTEHDGQIMNYNSI